MRPAHRYCERISARVRAMLLDEAQACVRLRSRLSAGLQTRREHAFAFVLEPGGPLLTGVIDLLAREPDGCALVVDYKTDQLAGEEDVGEHAQWRYALQRQIYALALLRSGATAVEVVHWFWQRPSQPVGVRYAGEDRESLERDLKRRLQAARERGFSVSPAPHRQLCETCPGRMGLCSWGQAETMREKPPSAGSPGP
jgi:RecB family exonuclease